MPNLVGIGNSQVPTNAMLGGLAYQDSVGEINLEKIKARIGDTAVDIFVYDTRKDSDGGAWRHRTQDLSWYNEGVSALRGARKEFPTIAVLVLQSLRLTIYDGDDPNLPMWMVVTGANNNYAIETAATCTAALNGVICIGCGGSGHDFYYVNFLQDAAFEMSTGAHHRFSDNIGTRSSHTRNRQVSSAVIINRKITDVAMVVLPNAPIDKSTGIPIPTMAISTDGGVSVITNDGTNEGTTVVDITSNTIIHHDPRNINFLGTRLLWTEGNNYDLQDRVFLNAPIPSADIQLSHGGSLPDGYIGYGIGGKSTNVYANNLALNTALSNEFNTRERKFQISGSDNHIILGCKHAAEGGLEQIYQNLNSPSNGILNVITTSYNSGWMHGDCKLALLSDTDTTNITGSNLMSGATYNTSARLDSYSYSAGSSTLVINDQQSSSDGYVNLNLTGLTASTHYVMMVTANQTYTPTSGFNHHIGNTADGAVYFEDNFVGTTSVQKVTFKTASNNAVPTIVLYSGYNGALTYSMDLRLAEFDRSPGHFSAYNSSQNVIGQKDGLAVYGTIEKQIVADGAELVSYRPDSASEGSNYLRMPLKSTEFDLTGEWSINFWARNNGNTGSNYSGWEIAPDDISSNNAYSLIPFSMYIQPNGLFGFRGMNGNASQDSNGTPLGVVNEWRCLNIVHRGGTTYVYIDGKLDVSRSVTYTNPTSPYSLYIFGWSYSTTRYLGRRHIDFSLFRMSETAPSEEQIIKMYHDERKLFAENAKCTLYGTSIPVTAIAYDDKTNVIHAGTSSGRSEFRGLNRINNTTTAVTTAISASNELVAEQ